MSIGPAKRGKRLVRVEAFIAFGESDNAVEIAGLCHQFGDKKVSPFAFSSHSAAACPMSQLESKTGKMFLALQQSCVSQVLRQADLRVQKGTLHILAGANGCGKSTLLRILGGLLPKQRGDVHVDGAIGMVLQNPDHQIVMPTVAAEVAFGLGRCVRIQSNPSIIQV